MTPQVIQDAAHPLQHPRVFEELRGGHVNGGMITIVLEGWWLIVATRGYDEWYFGWTFVLYSTTGSPPQVPDAAALCV